MQFTFTGGLSNKKAEVYYCTTILTIEIKCSDKTKRVQTKLLVHDVFWKSNFKVITIIYESRLDNTNSKLNLTKN